MNGYDKERAAVEQTLIQLQKEQAVYETKTRDVSKWVDLIQKNIDLEKLDREAVFELVDEITVSEIFDAEGKSCKTVNIKYKFVGYLDLDEKSIASN
jgi:hypothetical protein